MLHTLDFAKHLVADAVIPGGVAIDATVGNGHDTLFMAQQVGAKGYVYGFDIQTEALERTENRLRQSGLQDRVDLFHKGHESMISTLPGKLKGSVDAVMFNLGYLPGSEDKSIITRADTTVTALKAAAELLRPNGILTTVLYTGHPGGQEEVEAVERWASALAQKMFRVLSYRFINHVNKPPYLLAIEKRS